jgi:hypothetical protein
MAAKKNNSLLQAQKDLQDIDNLVDQLSSKTKSAFYIDPDQSMQGFKNTLRETVGIYDSLKQQQLEVSLLGKDANKMSSDQIKTLQKQLTLNKQKIHESKELLKIAGQQLSSELAIAQASGASADIISTLESKIKANTKAQDSFSQSIDQSLEAQKLVNKELAKARVGEGAKKGLDKVNSAAKSVSETIMGAFGITSLNPLQILLDLFGFVVKVAIDLDNELGAAAKSMNQTYEAAGKSRLAMIGVAEASGELLINSTHIEQTFLALNKSLGTGVVFEKMGKSLQKDIAFMAMMENYAGLTAEESNNVLKYSLQLGKSAKSTAGTLMAQYKASSLKYGIVVNEKDALKEIGNISESIKLSTAGGAAGLAKSLAAAKGLGISLNDVENSASGLLNFEDSIEKELTAELLTGKQLNLEKARQAALDNDLVTVAEEIKNQVGSAAEFAGLQRIQQESLAAAVGLTREQLSGALNVQNQQKEISKEALSSEEAAYNALVAKHGEQGAIGVMMQQQLALQTQQASSQEKIAAAKLKEKDVIAKDMIPQLVDFNKKIAELLKMLKDIFAQFGGFKTVLIAIGVIIAASIVSNIYKMISAMKTARQTATALMGINKALAGQEVVTSSYKMAGGLGPLGIGVVAGLIGAGIAALATYAVMNDGVISPSAGGSGYGKRVLHGPEGAISFNNKDTIVAGTNLFNKKTDDYMSPPGNIQLNNSSKEMSELKDAILALASRPIEVNVGGETIIKATTGALPNESGLAAAKNSFQIQ